MIKNGKSGFSKINFLNTMVLNNKIGFQRYFSDNLKSKNKSFDPYLVLDISRKAEWAEIKKQYYKLARQYHPDLNKNDEVSLEIYTYVI